MMEFQTVYFKKPGAENTEATLRLIQEWADRLSIQTVLISTTTGDTAVKAVELLKGHEVIAVTHSTGFSQPDVQELLPAHREKIEALGGKILTCQHAFAGISRAIRFKFGTYEIDEIVANALRIFGQGLKVAIEIALMAADAGLISTEKDVISAGGTESGIDTAIVLKPANVCRFFDLRIRGFLCKPWDF